MIYPSHAAWRMRSALIGQKVRHYNNGWKTVQDVIPSPYRNAYTIIFTDGSELDMSTYCHFEVQ